MKSYVCYIPDGTSSELHNVAKECYLKSEVDKVIAHQKYKRCLVTATLWSERIETSADAENELVALRRYNKWTELAKKYLEDN